MPPVNPIDPNERYSTWRKMLPDLAFKSYEGASQFAQLALKSLYALHGGGLVLIPAYLGIFSKDGNSIPAGLDRTLISFTVGLLLVGLATAVGYIALTLQQTYYTELLFGTEAKAKRFGFWSELLRWGGVILAFLSLGAFMFGCWWGAEAVISVATKVKT